ncbi:hypothetical protein QBC34DRAFT_222717 [Podospora aff. communis PSN243]|uniref:Nephrocystin 3-like N-terminal domain-containing protein n=1 Tax=Podospora aff. communis PSN243 TaxID=3040156 RepID=A0AAV9G517_9PEZI|nr:hypothetical protein QBC34DRAFT_222717 [Podospora aff. communis PSN243]
MPTTWTCAALPDSMTKGSRRSAVSFGNSPSSVYSSLVSETRKSTTLKCYAASAQSVFTEALTCPECSKALAFPEMSFRENAVREPLPSTCNWFFSLQVYQDWESRSDPSLFGRFLWVKGKPGAGKSTLIKEAVRRKKDRNDTNVIIGTFFFNARGTTLQHTLLGMLRSICWHIFNQDNYFKGCVVDHYRATSKSARGQWIPGENELRALVLDALGTRPASAPRIVLFIDALDECEESGARDIIRYLTTLLDVADKSGQQLDLCLSSRHYPTISSPRGFDIVVDDANRDDILRYIQAKIPSDIMTSRQSVEILHSMILQKSSGIFLWVVLVIDIVLQDVDEGKTAAEIEQSLKEAPSDLVTLFSDLIGTIRPRERANAMRLIHWVLLVNKPLRVPDLQAIQACHNKTAQPFGPDLAERPQTVHQLSLMWDGDVVRMRRQVCSMSRGLIEVKDVVQDGDRARPIIQFVHETVREFFMSEGSRLFQTPKFLGIGHISILGTCAQALCVPNLRTRRQARQDNPDLSLFGNNLDFSFLQTYSVDRLLFHAIRARSSMPLPNSIIHLAGRIATMISRREFGGRTSWNIVRWSTISPQTLEPLLVYDQQLESCAGSLALACTNVLQALESSQAKVDPPIPGSPASLLQSSLEDWFTLPHSLSNLSRCSSAEPTQVRNRKDRQTLSAIQLLLTNRSTLHIADMEGNTLLHLSSWLGLAKVTQLLLEHGLNPDLLNYCGMSPLSLACQYGHTAVASLLLDKGAKVDISGPGGYTPLHLAVEQSHLGLVNLLIFHDANPQAADVYGSTPLHIAAKLGAEAMIIKSLINANADLSVLNQDGHLPLQIAEFYASDLSPWSLNPRSRWSGHTTNFRKTVASRTQHRHSYVTPSGEMLSAWAPPARPSGVGSDASESLLHSVPREPESRSYLAPGGNRRQ